MRPGDAAGFVGGEIMDETRGDLPRPETSKDGKDGLNLRERTTAGELRLLDPHLAGLYERGLALARQIDQPETPI